MAQKEFRSMLKGAAVLTTASFTAKLLSAVYRVPFQNMVGDVGFYVYQQVYPIYGLAMTLALTGLPQFISKYAAEKETSAKQSRALGEIMPLMLLLGVLLWGTVFFGSGLFAGLMGDSALKPLIRMVSFTFLLMPGLSYYRGYFQGQLQMVPTAVSQVIEQVVRVAVILLSGFLFHQLGWDIYQTGTLAMAGAVFGGLTAFLVLRHYDQMINGRQLTLERFLPLEKPKLSLFRRFVVEGGLVSVYSGFLIIFQLIDSFFIKNSLVFQGLSEHTARVSKGVYDRGQPLVQLGIVAAAALSASFLPVLTKHMAEKKVSPALAQKKYDQTARLYLRLSVTLASAAAIGLMVLLPFINFALFKDSAGNVTLIVFMISVGLMSCIQAYQAIAQSRNQFRKPLKGAVLGLAGKFLMTGPFTYLWGTVGASFSTVLGLLLTLVYLILITSKDLNIFWKENRFFVKLFASLGIMIIVLLCGFGIADICGAFSHRISAFLWALCGVFSGGLAFILTAVRCRIFTIREWLMFPFGGKLLRLLQKKNRH